jgi:hypothetical protein
MLGTERRSNKPRQLAVGFDGGNQLLAAQGAPDIAYGAAGLVVPSSGYEWAPAPDMEIYYTTDDSKYFEESWIPVVKK